jgi:NitT/TauT family transport system substrate-binding protein
VALLAAATALTGCGGDDATEAASGEKAATLRLGYFPNVTHATAIVGTEKGMFAKALGSTPLKTSTFNAGPAAMEALNSGAIDATYIGPGPATNGYVKSQGKGLVIVSGATSGGASLVVKPEIKSAADLRGKTLSTPQLGNTQDIALRHWLKGQKLSSDLQGGGDVKIKPQENPQILDTFTQGIIDGAWVPEPYTTRLVQAGGKVLVDEAELWPGGAFVTTHLIVRREFFDKNPALVEALLAGQVEANAWVNANPAEAQKIVGDVIGKLSGKPLDPKITAAAWKNLTFTNDPVPASLLEGAKHAQDAGLLKGEVKLDGIYQLAPLNKVLKSKGQPEVKGS